MDSTTMIIIFIVALILSVGFLMLVLTLVPAINQLKSLLVDLEKTSREVRDLTAKIKVVSEKVDKDVEKVDAILDASKETVEVVSNSLKFINKNVLKKSAGFLAFIPAIKFGWNLVKKFKYKGGKNE
jgi:predicted PurR-regulated permease PerM